MFGEDISLLDLMALLKGIREKNLTLEIKITDGQWKKLSKDVISEMLKEIMSGTITSSNDIRLRLFA
jgi:hypothetical protein